jgi:hypothetical protein
VPTVLLDEQLAGDVALLRSMAEADEWLSVSSLLELRFATFNDVGLSNGSSDRGVWEFCQTNGYFLLTDNRNADNEDSLENTIRNSNTPASLPVFTIADRPRFNADQDYALLAFEKLIEYLIDSDNLRGTGRLFLP